MAWAFIYIPSFLGIRCSHMRLIPNFLEPAYTFLPEPSSTNLLFSMICKGSGETEQMCCFAWFFAARIWDLIPNFLELAYKYLAEPKSTSRLFSAIFKGSGENVQMCRLVWSFSARLCNKHRTQMNWFIKSKRVWSGSTTIIHLRQAHGTMKNRHRKPIVGRQWKQGIMISLPRQDDCKTRKNTQ